MKHIIEQVAQVAGYLWQKGWAERNGGNISYNMSEFAPALNEIPAISEPIAIGLSVPKLAGGYFLVTGTGRRMRYVESAPMDNMSIIRILPDGQHYVIVAEKDIRPTSELPTHLLVHNFLQTEKPSNKAVIHTHPIELVAMSHNRAFLTKDVLTHLLWSMIPETRAFCPKGLGIVPYTLPGSVELAQKTLDELHDYDVVMWEKHGVVAVGPDAVEAFDRIDVLNKSAQIYRDARAMGFIPEGMSTDQMNELKQAFNL
ncbi:MAG: rhamnulose-1-phosphate aldolase [Bacteroidales bacterium]|nr:rhamnulose-1-phosphate aldolase [Candidatus Colicola coprequi]